MGPALRNTLGELLHLSCFIFLIDKHRNNIICPLKAALLIYKLIAVKLMETFPAQSQHRVRVCKANEQGGTNSSSNICIKNQLTLGPWTPLLGMCIPDVFGKETSKGIYCSFVCTSKILKTTKCLSVRKLSG